MNTVRNTIIRFINPLTELVRESFCGNVPYAIPERISVWRLDKQRALSDGEAGRRTAASVKMIYRLWSHRKRVSGRITNAMDSPIL